MISQLSVKSQVTFNSVYGDSSFLIVPHHLQTSYAGREALLEILEQLFANNVRNNRVVLRYHRRRRCMSLLAFLHVLMKDNPRRPHL